MTTQSVPPTGEMKACPRVPTPEMVEMGAITLSLLDPDERGLPEGEAMAAFYRRLVGPVFSTMYDAAPDSAVSLDREAVARECQAVWRCAIGDATGALDVLKNRWLKSRRKAERDAGAMLGQYLDLLWAARAPAPRDYAEAYVNGNALIERIKVAMLPDAGGVKSNDRSQGC